MWTSNIKKYLFFLSVVLIVGILGGMLFVGNMEESSKEIVLNNINSWVMNLNEVHINSILSHLVILSLFLVLSLFVIGMPIYIFYIFYNGFSIGFIISSLGHIFGFKGFLFGGVYVLLTKGLFIILSFLFVFFLLRIGEKVFLSFVLKQQKNTKEQLIRILKKAMVLLVLVFINDLILYFWGGKLLNIFNFLLN